MIEITVRTLDSQNHQFSVDDGLTVFEFKQHIASTVNILPEIQRIIFCGRVLHDATKLIDLDVNGKVVHLVERPPPSDRSDPNPDPNPRHHHHHHHQHRIIGGNAMYFGSAIPFEPPNFAPPPPSHRLAASRLNVARRMLQRVGRVLDLLENPTARQPLPGASADAPADDAYVEVIPDGQSDEAGDTLADEENSNRPANASSMPVLIPLDNINNVLESLQRPAAASVDAETTFSSTSSPTLSFEDIVRSSTPRPEQSEQADQAEARSGNTRDGNNQGQEFSQTSELYELLATLGRLQQRFAPFLERYSNFLRDDPVVPAEEVRATDRAFTRVSEVLHHLGHAYHSLSDMLFRVRAAPPRNLLCRPIFIQQTAVVPAGFPIQVEAHINIGDAPSTPPTAPSAGGARPTHASGTQTPNPAAASAAEAQTTTTSTPTTNANTNANANRQVPLRNMLPNLEFMNFAGMQPSAVHVQAIPIGIRAMRPDGVPMSAGIAMPPAGNQAAAGGNPNVEFFMEVTPERITINSLETTILDGNQADGARLQQNGAPTPEFIQSIVQMAGQLVQRGVTTSDVTFMQRPMAPETPASTTTATTPAATQPSTPTNGGQNSQARGNTQTNPTTATHTRSTSRPHVHFAQRAIQGFDPFLPCCSQHVFAGRRPMSRTDAATATASAATATTNNNQPTNNNTRPQNGNVAGAPPAAHPVYNLVRGVLSSLQNIYGGPRRNAPPADGTAPTTHGSTSTATTGTNTVIPPGINHDQMLQSLFTAMATSSLGAHRPQHELPGQSGPTIAQLLQMAGDQGDGQGVFNDITMLLARNLTISDLFALNMGRLDPLCRIRCEIRSFVASRILEGNTVTPGNVDRAVDKMLDEMQPFLQNLSHLSVTDDIDLVRSAQMLFRLRLPNIINLSVSRRPNAIRQLVDQMKLIARHLCALILHSSSNGVAGVEEVLQRTVSDYVDGIASDLQDWTLVATRAQLQEFMLTLDVPSNLLQPYIVRNVDTIAPAAGTEPEPMDVQSNEMEVEQTATPDELQSESLSADGEAGAPAILDTSVLGPIQADDEELVGMVLGPDPWHEQVPQDWVPIIARDSQRQRRQSQVPLSDAYLNGMPSKRRKVVTSNKPQGTLPQVITDSIRRAVTTVGLDSAANVTTVATEAGADLSVQSAYRDLLRTSVQESIQDNEDFTPERFPNASSYFNKSQ